MTRSCSCARHAQGVTPKLTIPSPSMVHYRGGNSSIDSSVYPDLDEFWTDLTAAYNAQMRSVYELGCRYLQLDDTSLAYVNDPAQRDAHRRDRRRSRAPARDLHRKHQPRARRAARRISRSPRTCAAATTSRCGRPRVATTSSPRRCSTTSRSTASSSSTTTSAPAASSRCASCRRASTSSSAW